MKNSFLPKYFFWEESHLSAGHMVSLLKKRSLSFSFSLSLSLPFYLSLYIYLPGGKSCLVAPGVAVPPWATETVITPGWRLMRAGYCTFFNTLYDEYIYIYIYICMCVCMCVCVCVCVCVCEVDAKISQVCSMD